MHKAYELQVIVENLPLDIESIESFDDQLLVGTKQGHLLLYNVNQKRGKFDVNIKCSLKCFAKKPITQISVCKEFKLLIILSDNVVSTHDMDMAQSTFPLVSMLQKTRGATLFATDIRPSDKGIPTLYIAVVVKKKIQIYVWDNEAFKEAVAHLSLPDTPLAIAWCGESLYVGFKTEYCYIKMNGEQKSLFLTGRKQFPLITRIHNQQAALGRDEKSIFVDQHGGPASKYALAWSETPTDLIQDYPYIIALLKDSIEIQTLEPKLLVQTLKVSNPRLVNLCHRGKVYVANSSTVWCLHFVPLQDQITSLVESKHFELALILGDLENVPTEQEKDDNELSITKIQNLYAFDLFNKKQFQKALHIFFKMNTDPIQVIGLYPKLLPEKRVSHLRFPSTLVPIQEGELESALSALVEFLTEVRTALLARRTFSSEQSPVDSVFTTDMNTGAPITNRRTMLLQIVDTSLLKCYLMSNDALLAPFLRIPDNHCHLEESERALKLHQKYSELIVLYQCKGQHKTALDLLKKHYLKPNSPLRGHDRTIQYLQNLGVKYFDLIKEFAKWVLELHPEDGLRIFIEDLPETENLPRQEVYDYLLDVQPALVIPFLEHIIQEWKEDKPFFHNQLIHSYLDLMALYKDDPEHSTELEKTREKLVQFLKNSESYSQEAFPHKLFHLGLYHEAAIVMERLGSHQEALTVYMHFLHQPKEAEQYCLRNYSESSCEESNVFILLLKLYLGRQDGCQLLLRYTPKEDLSGALRLLNKYPNHLDPLQVLPMLSPKVLVSNVQHYLRLVLEQQRSKLHHISLTQALCQAENIQAKGNRLRTQSLKLMITDLNICRICLKRLGNSAFVRFPDSTLVHYSCKDKYRFT